MCFTLEKKGKRVPLPKIAKQDIICYKTVRIAGGKKANTIQSLVQDFTYELGKKVTAKFGIFNPKDNSAASIDEGLHSYINEGDARPGRSVSRTTKVMVCVIPKGSKYYQNDGTGQYCSNRLIPVTLRGKCAST